MLGSVGLVCLPFCLRLVDVLMVNVGTVKVGKYNSPTDPTAMYVYASVVYLGFSRLFWLFLAEKKVHEHHKGDCDGLFQKRRNTHNRL